MTDQGANEAAYSAGYARQEREEFVARNAHRLGELKADSVEVRATCRGDSDDVRVAVALWHAARRKAAGIS